MTAALPRIRTIFFDMGNVLVQFSHDRMVQQMASLCDCSADAMREFLMRDGRLVEFECGRYSEAEFVQLIESRFQTRLEQSAFQRAFADIFWLTPGIEDLLHKLRQTDVRLILLSNTSVTHLDFIQQNFEVLNAMHAVTTSFQAGACKPYPAIYTAALQSAACRADECFYTDDIPAYIEAAASHGIRGAPFVSVAQVEQELRGIGVFT
jgi:HAD superfamily hydrolase (TIGR01509 family)